MTGGLDDAGAPSRRGRGQVPPLTSPASSSFSARFKLSQVWSASANSLDLQTIRRVMAIGTPPTKSISSSLCIPLPARCRNGTHFLLSLWVLAAFRRRLASLENDWGETFEKIERQNSVYRDAYFIYSAVLPRSRKFLVLFFLLVLRKLITHNFPIRNLQTLELTAKYLLDCMDVLARGIGKLYIFLCKDPEATYIPRGRRSCIQIESKGVRATIVCGERRPVRLFLCLAVLVHLSFGGQIKLLGVMFTTHPQQSGLTNVFLTRTDVRDGSHIEASSCHTLNLFSASVRCLTFIRFLTACGASTLSSLSSCSRRRDLAVVVGAGVPLGVA